MELKESYKSTLATFYDKGKDNKKICLSYFISILYEKENILNINISSMSNNIKVVYLDNNMKQEFKNKMKFFENIEKQKQ